MNLGGEDHNDSAQLPRLNSIDYNVLFIKYIPDSNFWGVTFQCISILEVHTHFPLLHVLV